MADDSPLLRRRRAAADEVAQLRTSALWSLLVGSVLLAAQVSALVADEDGTDWLRWALAAGAVVIIGHGVLAWRRHRRERAGVADLVGVDLAPVTGTRLSQLVAAALEGAAPDEVTPPVTPGERWTPERIEWLRAFHRDRRAGLDGPAREATWVVLDVGGENQGGGRVAGSVRLRRTEQPGVLETGIWLVRDARGRGIGRQALALVVDRAREAGAAAVQADTTSGNAGARSVLQALGFTTTVDGERVRAELALRP